jgi:Zn-dependent protease/CBS domain-containing protein
VPTVEAEIVTKERKPLFRLLGFPIRVDASWFVIAALLTWSLATATFPSQIPDLEAPLYWILGFAGAMGLFASVLFHELGHSVVARRFGVNIRGIRLFIFGGVAELEKEPDTPKAEFWIAIAGPLVSALLGAAGIGLSIPLGETPAAAVVRYLGELNLLLAGFNLVPAFPLDGGRVLRAALWAGRGDLERATRITARLGAAFGALLIGLAIASVVLGNLIGGLWLGLIGLFLRGAAKSAESAQVTQQFFEGKPISAFMTPEPRTVSAHTPIQRFVDDELYVSHHRLYPVVSDAGELVGLLRSRDLARVPRTAWGRPVKDAATPPDERSVIDADTPAADALTRMATEREARLCVVRDGRPVGVICLKDLLEHLELREAFGG